MTKANLAGRRVAILATDGFEQSELERPLKTLRAAGAEVDVISPKSHYIQSVDLGKIGDEIKVDKSLEMADSESYDALVLPGGMANPDFLRIHDKSIQFIRQFVAAGKPIAAIGHAPWALLETGIVRDRYLTSWPSLKTDLSNGGAKWVDQQVVRDGMLITSRKPEDLTAFCLEIVALIAEVSLAR